MTRDDGGPPRVFITGSRGQVGWELRRALAPFGVIEAHDLDTLDLLDERAAREAVRKFKPDVIINAAAYTAVDKAESDKETCRLLNTAAPAALADEAEKLGAWMVHYSTDYVFGGNKDGNGRPRTEDDAPAPANYYGETKLAGDMAIRERASKHLIFRTSWVYASRGSNFLLTMLRLFEKGGEIRVVDDQIGSPTWARYLADVTAMSLRRAMERGPRVSGVYNVTSAGSVSWFGFAGEILEYSREMFPAVDAVLLPIPSEEYPTAAARPKWSVLSADKAARVFGIRAVPRKDAARLCIDEVKERRLK
ncbi:dTDP-4-dehydrorhamnose reductase [Synergistales bacterium]|nr:dTDP-4-dehydrorhamnose reductase [Synergistales bacterium]